MIIIVGSTALAYSGISPRMPKDVDLWVDSTYEIHKGTDAKVIPKEILLMLPTRKKWNEKSHYTYATPDAIYTIKCSHASWDIHWDKTISDILWLKSKGCELIPELYWQLYKYWGTVHGNKDHLSLDKSKSDFFDDYVPHTYDHDWLHECVAKPNRPVYTTILKDNQEVLIDKAKFIQLPVEKQIKLFKEEVCVIALERWLIPSNFKIPKQVAYRYAIKKTITNLTKNWATLFMLDNLESFVKMGDSIWYNNFLTTTEKGITMHPTIKKIMEKANDLKVETSDIEQILFHGYSVNKPDLESEFYKRNPEYAESDTKDYEFSEYLKSLGYDLINREGGEERGSSAHSVIKLDGELFRADYGYQSYDGYYIDDVWDWTPVKAVEKTVTIYE